MVPEGDAAAHGLAGSVRVGRDNGRCGPVRAGIVGCRTKCNSCREGTQGQSESKGFQF